MALLEWGSKCPVDRAEDRRAQPAPGDVAVSVAPASRQSSFLHPIVLTGLAGLNEPPHAEVAVAKTMHAQFPNAEQAELIDTFASYGADPQAA